MSWGKARGWAQAVEAAGGRFTQVIRTIQEVMPGGVIRYAKAQPDDDAATGFWLGVTGDRLAKFSLGGPASWLKWTGTALRIQGFMTLIAGDTASDWLQWIGRDNRPVAYVHGTDAWGHLLEIGTPIQDAAGDPGMIDLFVDGDFGASLRLRLQTVRGAGNAGTKLSLLAGNTEVFTVDADGNVWAAGAIHGVGGVEFNADDADLRTQIYADSEEI